MNEVARRAVFHAHQEALERGASAIDTEHLLLGVLRSDPDLIRRIAGAAGFEEDALLHRIDHLSPRKPKPANPPVEMPLTERSQGAVGLVRWRLASELTTTDVLVGLINVDGVASQVLKELGVTERMIRDAAAQGKPAARVSSTAPHKGMKQTSVEHIGRSQAYPRCSTDNRGGKGGSMTSQPFLLLGVLTIALQPNAQPVVEGESCTPSPLIRGSAPPDPNADPVGPADWYINTDRTIWAGPVPAGGWPSGGKLYSGKRVVNGHKTYWVRPAGTQLLISGRRLDGSAPPVEAHIPCCYPTGFQIVGLFFPGEGCWEVHAKAGESELRFVTHVKPPPVAHAR